MLFENERVNNVRVWGEGVNNVRGWGEGVYNVRGGGRGRLIESRRLYKMLHYKNLTRDGD